MIENWNKIKNSVRGKIVLPLYILPFFPCFLGLTDQKKAGSRFFWFQGICVYVLDDPMKKKKIFLKTLVRRAIFLFWGVWALTSPPGAPGGPGGGIFWLITILWHRSNMFSRKKWGSKIFPAEKSVWLWHSLLKCYVSAKKVWWDVSFDKKLAIFPTQFAHNFWKSVNFTI